MGSDLPKVTQPDLTTEVGTYLVPAATSTLAPLLCLCWLFDTIPSLSATAEHRPLLAAPVCDAIPRKVHC